MRGKWVLAAGSVILLGIAAGALSVLWRERRAAPSGAAAPAPPPVPAEVSLPGRVEARNVVAVAATTDGSVEEFFADVGQEVFEGQLIARIRNMDLVSARDVAQSELDRAQSKLNNLEAALVAGRLEASRAGADASRARTDFERAEKTYLRQQMLYREGATPRLVFEKSEKEYLRAKTESETLAEVAKAADLRVESILRDVDFARKTLAEKSADLEDANEALLAAEVHSPVDGMVIARRGETGARVDRTMRDLFQIAVDLAALQVVVEPEPPVLAHLRPGQQAIVRLAEMDESLTGEVHEIAENGRAIIHFTSPNPAIRPGLTAQALIRIR